MQLLVDIIATGFRAHTGAAWADAEFPDWHRSVDLALLDLSQCDRCILGQIGRALPLYDEESWGGDGSGFITKDYLPVTIDGQARGFVCFVPGFGVPGTNRTEHRDYAYSLLDEAWICLVKDRYNQGI